MVPLNLQNKALISESLASDFRLSITDFPASYLKCAWKELESESCCQYQLLAPPPKPAQVVLVYLGYFINSEAGECPTSFQIPCACQEKFQDGLNSSNVNVSVD